MIPAQKVAGALLLGEWARIPLLHRVRAALGFEGIRARALVDSVLRAFPKPPFRQPTALAMLIIESVPLIPAHPVRFVLEPLEFQPSRHAVPPLAGSAQLAEWLDVPIEWLAWFTDEKGISRGDRLGHYKHRWIPKSSGGARLIQAPKHRLKVMQRKVLHGLLSHVAVHEAAHGCVVGRSARTHAALHQKKRIVALRARLHNARSAAQPIATRDVLLGQIGWIAGESATRRARLMRAFEAITWKSP